MVLNALLYVIWEVLRRETELCVSTSSRVQRAASVTQAAVPAMSAATSVHV